MRNPYSYVIMLFLAVVLAACGGQASITDVTGNWTGEIIGSNGSAPFSMALTQSGTNVTGTVTLDGSISVTGAVTGNLVTLGAQDASGSIQISGTVNGNSISGTMTLTVGDRTGVLSFTTTK